jgi:hypothetical protein
VVNPIKIDNTDNYSANSLCYTSVQNGYHVALLRGLQVSAKSVPEGAKFCNTLSANGGDVNFEDFARLLKLSLTNQRDFTVPP